MYPQYRRSASALVIAACLAGGGTGVAYAQQSASQDSETAPPEREVIVITGSNIAGAAESAALPVEVYTADESLKQGGQTALEFTKTLSVVGSTVGETNQFQAGYASIGSATLNLRGLGGGRTLTIFNGRRFSENINMIPSIALARTEILKDGGAVIYGADATGGVVNFITRDEFEGFVADAEYKFIDGGRTATTTLRSCGDGISRTATSWRLTNTRTAASWTCSNATGRFIRSRKTTRPGRRITTTPPISFGPPLRPRRSPPTFRASDAPLASSPTSPKMSVARVRGLSKVNRCR
ncbi:MAG: TonB-dependent receptor plug domain-containing protein [Hyphomonadaceae bacterium]